MSAAEANNGIRGPLAGTPQMVAAPGTGLDLPLKVLAWQDVANPRSWPRILPAWKSSCWLLLHPIQGRKVPACVIQDLRIGRMIGGFDRHDGFSQLRILVAKVAGEFLLGLCGADQQNFMGAGQRLRDVIEKMMIGAGSMTAVRALAAVHPLMPIFRVHHGLFLLCRREVPRGCLLVIDPNNRMIV